MHPSNLCNKSHLRDRQIWICTSTAAHCRAGRSCGLWEQLNLMCCHMRLCNAKPQALFTPATKLSLQKRVSVWIGRWHTVHHGFEIQIQKAVGNLTPKNWSRRKTDSVFVTMEGNTRKPQLWTHALEGTTTEVKDKCNLSDKINYMLQIQVWK